MDLILSFLERVITSILVSVLIALLSFSYFTGKFPPRKDEVIKAIRIVQQMIVGTSAFNRVSQQVHQNEGKTGVPNLAQMIEFQKMALRRTEATMELLEIFKKIPLAAPDVDTGIKLQRISANLSEVEKEMAEIATQFQKTTENPQSQ